MSKSVAPFVTMLLFSDVARGPGGGEDQRAYHRRRRRRHISNSFTSSGTMIDSTGRDQRLGQHSGKVVD